MYRERWSRQFDHGAPIRALPAAPIAGVLLIIVIVMLAVWPQAIHAVTFDLPYSVPPLDDARPLEMAPINRIAVTSDGQPSWNGDPVSLASLGRRLEETKGMPIQPGLAFEPDPDAGYDISLRVMAVIARAGLNDALFCFGGIGKHRDFGSGKAPAKRSRLLAPPCNPNLNRKMLRTD